MIKVVGFTYGFLGTIIQATVIRELLINFIGNELTLGTILGNWVMSCAIGSILFSHLFSKNELIKKISIPLFLFLLFIYTSCLIYITRSIKSFFGYELGIIPHIFHVYLFSLIILLPLCLILGGIYAGCVANLYKEKLPAGVIYYMESIGAFFGGIFFTLCLTGLDSLFTTLLCNFLIMILLLFLLYFFHRQWRKYIIFIPLIFVVLFLNYKNINNASLRNQWHSLKIQKYQNSKYGNITIVKTNGQETIFFNGYPISTFPPTDIHYNEDTVHFPMLLHENPKKILLIGGGIGTLTDEILKHDVDKIDYTEPDSLLLKTMLKYTTEKKEINIINTDHITHLTRTNEKYDVIFVNTLLPTSLWVNRFYTLEFFKLAKKSLADNGIISIPLAGSLTYLNPELKALNALLYQTLKKEFKNVFTIPGDGYNLFICSDAEINENKIYENFQRRKLKTILFNRIYLNYRLSEHYKNWFHRNIEETKVSHINSDYQPISLYFAVAHWNASLMPYISGLFRFIENIKPLYFFIIIGIVFLIYLLTTKTAIYWITTSSGFVGMSFYVILLLLFQVLKGYIYEKVALLTGIFMLGLACGAWLSRKSFKEKYIQKLILLEITIAIFGVGLLTVGYLYFDLFFYIFSFIGAMIIGMEFPLLNLVRLQTTKDYVTTAGLLYGLDCIGGYIGAILVSSFLLPLYGVHNILLLIVILKMMSIILLTLRPQIH